MYVSQILLAYLYIYYQIFETSFYQHHHIVSKMDAPEAFISFILKHLLLYNDYMYGYSQGEKCF